MSETQPYRTKTTIAGPVRRSATKGYGVYLGDLSWLSDTRRDWHRGRAWRRRDVLVCDEPNWENVWAIGPARDLVWGERRRKVHQALHGLTR